MDRVRQEQASGGGATTYPARDLGFAEPQFPRGPRSGIGTRGGGKGDSGQEGATFTGTVQPMHSGFKAFKGAYCAQWALCSEVHLQPSLIFTTGSVVAPVSPCQHLPWRLGAQMALLVQGQSRGGQSWLEPRSLPTGSAQ